MRAPTPAPHNELVSLRIRVARLLISLVRSDHMVSNWRHLLPKKFHIIQWRWLDVGVVAETAYNSMSFWHSYRNATLSLPWAYVAWV
jgi:hypothetical protein